MAVKHSLNMRGSLMNKLRRTVRLSMWAAALLCVAAFVFPATAQSNKGTITGTVTDPNGAVIKDAKVTATNVATGETRDATTGGEGEYTIPALDPGVYKITVDAQGFTQAVVDQVKLDTSSRQAVNVTLTTGAVSGGTVTVTAEAPLAETETSVRGDLITGKQVTDLPLTQRNFTQLAALSPGELREVALRERKVCDLLARDEVAAHARLGLGERRLGRHRDGAAADGARGERDVDGLARAGVELDLVNDRLGEALCVHGNLVDAGVERGDGVFAFAAGRRVARLARGDVGRRDLRVLDDRAVRVCHSPGDRALVALGGGRKDESGHA